MKIKQKLLSCIVLGAGLIGAVLCLLAASLGTDARGLLPNHLYYYLIYILSVCVPVFLFFSLRDVKGKLPYSKLFPKDNLSVLGYGAAAFGIAYTAFEVYRSALSPLAMVAGITGFVAAVCMCAIGYFRYSKMRPHYIFHAIVTIHFVFLLIYRYQAWNTEPQLPLYFTQLMASLALMLTMYQRTALDAGIGQRKDFAFFALSALFFCCLAAINDYTVLYLCMAAWCLTNQCSLQKVQKLPPMQLPEEVLYCMDILMENGYRVYAVGGCVRDHLMGRTPYDYDLCTSAKPEEICELFERHQLVRSGEKHGTIGVIVAGESYEITTFRTEGSYSDARHPDWVEFVDDIKKDLARRDFTVNAMAYNPKKGFVDPFGGMRDLKSKTLRAVGEPATRFQEDALRILRGVRFAVRFDLAPEEKTLQAMSDCAPLMGNLAKERVCSELSKLLPLITTEQLMQYKDVLTQVIPALNEDDTLYGNAAAVVGQLDADLPLRMAALLHGLDEATVSDILQELRCSNVLRNRVTLLIRLLGQDPVSDKKQLLQLMGEHGEEAVEQLIALQTAIATATGEDTGALEGVRSMLESIQQENNCLTIKELAVSGTDLLALGVEAGPLIGQCLEFLLSLVQDEIVANEKEELLEAANGFFATQEEN